MTRSPAGDGGVLFRPPPIQKLTLDVFRVTDACGCLKEGRAPPNKARRRPMAKSTSVAVRSYRIYFRDSMNTLSPAFEVDLGSDGEARAAVLSIPAFTRLKRRFE